MAAAGNCCNYSCETATKTLEWIQAIIKFIKPYHSLINAHVVNFFKDRLWEGVDKEWIDCLHKESVENVLLIPSGFVQDCWPDSLKEFILTLRSLVIPREQVEITKVLPDVQMASLNSVLTQGMNLKKKHEVEVLSAVVSCIAQSVKADTIIDVGAGQGYLAQALAFQYHHSVVAIDACSHNGKVTNVRAERINKHYAAQIQKSSSGSKILNVPKTITCQVMSTDMLKALTPLKDEIGQPKAFVKDCKILDESNEPSLGNGDTETSLVLAGLHACGDLSVTMLKTFLECKEVKAVVSIGCCYNLLSEEAFGNVGSHSGFPMSHGVKSAGLSLGKSSRDLACQSAERWKSMGKDAGLNNFDLHAFRAAFQMVLSKYYPELLISSPSIGRQGKALRRQQQRRILESKLHHELSTCSSLPQKQPKMKESFPLITSAEVGSEEHSVSELPTNGFFSGISSNKSTGCEGQKPADKYFLFEKFSLNGLRHLGFTLFQDINFHEIWKEVEPFAELIGPYWSIRASLGPLLETLILLDRLLFLQENCSSSEVIMELQASHHSNRRSRCEDSGIYLSLAK